MSDEAQQEVAAKFESMARCIVSQSSGAGFGGAFVVVPPKDGGEPLETLILDSRQDPTQFWLMLKTKCDTEIATLDQKQRTNSAFARPR